jgi:hypothetical protein
MMLIGLNAVLRSRGVLRPKFSISFALFENRGRREDRVRAAPAVSRAKLCIKHAHEHTGLAETHRPSLRNGFTAYFELALVTGFLATIIPEKRLLLKGLDASTGASGPHDFTVRICRARQSQLRVHRSLPLVCDDGQRPLVGQDGGSRKSDLPDVPTGIFLSEGLDRLLVICPSCQFVASFGGCLVGQINPSNASVHAARMRMSGAMRPDSHNLVRIDAVGGHRVGRRSRRSGMKHVAVRMIKRAGLSNRGLGPERF